VDLVVLLAAAARLSRRRQAVNLVEEDYTRLPSLSLLEEQT